MFRQHAVHSREGALLRAPHELVIRSQRAGDVHLVQLIGELDRESAPALEAELKRVEATDVRQIIVDLSGLAFIGSDGLKVFIHANARSRRGGDRLMLAPGSDEIQSTFEVAGLLSRLPFEDDRAAKRCTYDEPRGAQIIVSRPVHEWASGGR
jgi:anti-sigma B factor antagonist